MIRLVWAALLPGQVFFGLTVIAIGVPQSGGKPLLGTGTAALAWKIGLGVWVVLTAAGYISRSQIYKRSWKKHSVTVGGYFIGNLVLWALMEIPFFVSVVDVFATGHLFPGALPALLAIGVMLVNFPTGGPLQPHPPVFDEPAR